MAAKEHLRFGIFDPRRMSACTGESNASIHAHVAELTLQSIYDVV
jgi:hypothetical protein